MSIQIDQSGKIEDTAHKTILAFSNGSKNAVILSARDKRKLQKMFRDLGAPRLFIEYVFAALLVILLRSCKARVVTVDLEYPKSNRIIESLIKPFTDIEVRWSYIGKSSPAHDVAYKVFTDKLKIGQRVSIAEIIKIVTISGIFLKEKSRWALKDWTFTNQSALGPGISNKYYQKKKGCQVDPIIV